MSSRPRPRPIALFLLVVFATIMVLQYIFMMANPAPFRSARDWQDIVAEKRRADNAKIPSAWKLDADTISEAKGRRRIAGSYIEGLLDSDTRRITALDVSDLVTHMANSSLTAVEVVSAFCKRAAYAHQMGDVLLEIGFDLALAQAADLDEYYENHKTLVGPLHGIPLTLKDQFHIKGLQTSMAFVGWIGTFEGRRGTGLETKFESQLIEELKSLGAIPIGKTSLVQSLWAPETNNNILGYARNPWNQLLSTGGSSGGEGAMQALRGSAFGIGTDVGGSVSMPASFQGVFSLKPSAGRIPFRGVANTGPGQQVMPTVVGIMGQSVHTLQLVLKSILSTEPWIQDPYTLPLPWRSEKEYEATGDPARKPAFGFMENDGIVAPHPPVSRALDLVKKALEHSGYQLVDWIPPSNNESIAIHGPIARGDGCPDVIEAINLSGEPIVPEIQSLFPDGKPKEPLPLPEYEQVVIHMKKYRQSYNDYWLSSAKRTDTEIPVQAVISPVTPYAGIEPGKFMHSPYTSSLNVLDLPSVVIPVTFADKDIDKMDPNYAPLTGKDRVNMATYDAEVHDGAPVSVQLFGQRLDEERLLSLAQIVVEALEGYRQNS